MFALLISATSAIYLLGNDGANLLSKNELEKLQGKWVVVSARCFRFDDDSGPEGSTYTFKGNDLTVFSHGYSYYTVSLSALATPKEINLSRIIDDSGRRGISLGIYERKGDELRICLAGYAEESAPGRRYTYLARPSDFSYNCRHSVYTLKRQGKP